MKTEYVEFDLVLGNGEKCKVRYCDEWGVSLFGKSPSGDSMRDYTAF
jgi:hypothetical protein